ncbi:MAG: Fe-S cluster assembly sulfur transfer protein SufU [Chthonomonadales bacterium]
MTALRELYQETILDHYKRPRNFREMPDADRHVEGYNPLCGDRVTVYLKLRDGVIQDVSFVGQGCAISTASASLMTEALRGKTEAEAEELFQRFHDLVAGSRNVSLDEEELGKLAVFAGVREFPARVKCASLAWHTLHAAIKGDRQKVSTE